VPERDRDSRGRARSARPRDALGRPLPYGAEGVAEDPEIAELEQADEATLVNAAQRLLDEGRPFEAHALLEAAWKRAPAPERALWRALAQLAVGLTHRLRGNDPGAQALFARSAQALEAVEPGLASQKGIDVLGLAQAARQLAAGNAAEVRLRQN
jgi:predicted metal-dependent hydrolase